MTYREVVLSIEGLRERDKLYRDWIRRATYIISCSGMNAKIIVKKFETELWPLEDMAKPQMSDRALERLKQLRDSENEKNDIRKVKKIIDARGS